MLTITFLPYSLVFRVSGSRGSRFWVQRLKAAAVKRLKILTLNPEP